MMTREPNLFLTLWPTFPHYKRFISDKRLSGIRLNSAMIEVRELDKELGEAFPVSDPVSLYFDIKGRQLRVTDVFPAKDHLELRLNHPIQVPTPIMVLFKGGEDSALLREVRDGINLIFEGGPYYNVYPGESLHIRHPGLAVGGPLFTKTEAEKMVKAKKKGFSRWLLSYTQAEADVAEMRNFIGDDLLIAKIEDQAGLEFVGHQYKKRDNLVLMAACGDLYVEVERPHQIMEALNLIIEKDPEGFVGSRMLLSLVQKPVPSMADLLQLAWLYDKGYRNFMLCDELCLKEELLAAAVNVFECFKQSYGRKTQVFAD